MNPSLTLTLTLTLTLCLCALLGGAIWALVRELRAAAAERAVTTRALLDATALHVEDLRAFSLTHPDIHLPPLAPPDAARIPEVLDPFRFNDETDAYMSVDSTDPTDGLFPTGDRPSAASADPGDLDPFGLPGVHFTPTTAATPRSTR